MTLRELLAELGITVGQLSTLSGLPAETVTGLLDYTLAVDEDIAGRLERALGRPSAQFWLGYQANYEADLARGATDVSRDRGYGN